MPQHPIFLLQIFAPRDNASLFGLAWGFCSGPVGLMLIFDRTSKHRSTRSTNHILLPTCASSALHRPARVSRDSRQGNSVPMRCLPRSSVASNGTLST